MKEKSYKIYACKMTIDTGGIISPLCGENLISLLDSIRLLPIDFTLEEKSRYKKNGTCLIFSDELKNISSSKSDFLSAIYIKRRDNKPLEDDGRGNLQSITLSSDENQIAEVCYIIFSLSKGIIYWISNPLVSGVTGFADYLNFTYKKSCDINSIQNTLLSGIAQIVFNYIQYPKSHDDYEKESFQPISLDFNLSLTNDDIQQLLLFEKSDGDEITLLRKFAESSNCGRIKIEISAPKYRKNKKQETSRPILNKRFISNFYEGVHGYFGKNDKDRFSVKGIDIDENTKILDLINGKLIYPLVIEYEGSSLSVIEVLSKFTEYVKSINKEVEAYI